MSLARAKQRVFGTGVTCNEILTLLLRELLIKINRRMNEDVRKESGFIRKEMDHAKKYFQDHYNEEINIEQYAASRNMSTSWFGRSFSAAFGISPKQYLVDLRIHKAQILLETTDGTVNEISRAVGYDNPMYFSRLFRKSKGLSPLKYRKIYREHFSEMN